ncbi:MAG: hypothetical protein ACTHMI_19935 [Mucilaginibacter sp.]|uniref:hypothetical protein n=1 Tax=Mucilaginibacter sp. L3T2-6 TaxID=3062491 RepID=UPI0026752787|nr:hypothetical protein [Mucilaginibacter sp. L3T2-6]MDO3644414.1 hypothetical protein [Mucilaginibacter sp. L3T2-6]MDV6216866.1 hypothetical protein [Mucilaginibacter sp. L3T2-6]
MKTKHISPVVAAISTMILCAFVMATSCSKKNDTPAPVKPDANGFFQIDLIGLRSDSGYAYKLGYHLPQSGDTEQNPNISKLHLFENGVELGPAHSAHIDIRKYGLGQYSHWGTVLYFSTSDNSNPLTNGRKYSYKME